MSHAIRDTDALQSHLQNKLPEICQTEFGGTAVRMAEALDISQSKMSRVLRGKPQQIDVYLDVAAQVAEYLSVPLKEITDPGADAEKDATKPVDVYSVAAGAGEAKRPVREWGFTRLHVPTRFLEAMCGKRRVPEEVGVIEASGKSMYPEIENGDLVVWTPCDTIPDGGIYVIRLEGALLVKIVQKMPGWRYRIGSLNSEFEDKLIWRQDDGCWRTSYDDKEIAVDFDVIGEYITAVQRRDLFAVSQRIHEAVSATLSATVSSE
jgi:hypothetical protein